MSIDLSDFHVRWKEGWFFTPSYADWDEDKHLINIMAITKAHHASSNEAKRVFSSNEEAREFVKRRAEEGSAYHIAVLAYIAKCRLTP